MIKRGEREFHVVSQGRIFGEDLKVLFIFFIHFFRFEAEQCGANCEPWKAGNIAEHCL